MDGAVRILREGRLTPDHPAAFVLITDDLSVLEGSEVLLQCTSAVAAAIDAGRCQAALVHAVAAERPPGELESAGAARVTDLFTTACAWLDGGGDGEAGGGGANSTQGCWQRDGLQRIAQAAGLVGNAAAADGGGGDGTSSSGGGGGGARRQLCVVIDSLSALLQRHAPARVLGLLDALQRSPSVSSVLALVHTDLHSSHVLASLATAATALLELSAVTPLQRALSAGAGRAPPHGVARLAAKRRSGRLRAETQFYALGGGGGAQRVVAYAPPPAALAAPDAKALVERALAGTSIAGGCSTSGGAAAAAAAGATAAAAAPGGGADELAARLGGGVSMRLALTEEERAARAAVVLPYERRASGARGAISSGGSTMAGAAGGGLVPRQAALGENDSGGGSAGGGAKGLGTITYERDSDVDADSDEEADDGLDL